MSRQSTITQRLAIVITHDLSFFNKPAKTETSLLEHKYWTIGPNHLSLCCFTVNDFLEMFKGCKLLKTEAQEDELGGAGVYIWNDF